MLSYKEHLPVSQVVVGDLDRPGSEAKVSVGPVRCQGDRKFPAFLLLILGANSVGKGGTLETLCRHFMGTYGMSTQKTFGYESMM